jgi:hypothetical protein
MKDWKAAVRTWEKNRSSGTKPQVYKNQNETDIISKLKQKVIS